jgi:hypothetical protein
MLQSPLFMCKNKYTYPPFKNGLYLEEYFFRYFFQSVELDKDNNIRYNKRKYIPVIWTNFQIESWFPKKKQEMQSLLDQWIKNNPSENGYFTVVQHDDGPLLRLPQNTLVYGACSGDIPIPLIYENINNTLVNIPNIPFSKKTVLCSFVGNITNNPNQSAINVRQVIFDTLQGNPQFLITNSGGWTAKVNDVSQRKFITFTRFSKFALAPRGYGRSSFRFFECFQLGTIPVYLWNDIEWLPFPGLIDYNRLCISLHISKIGELEKRLLAITEEQYGQMFEYYHQVKYLFSLEGMSKQIMDLI